MRQNVDVICKHCKNRVVPLAIFYKECDKEIQAYVIKHRVVKPYGKTAVPNNRTQFPAYTVCFECTLAIGEKVRTYGILYDSQTLGWSLFY